MVKENAMKHIGVISGILVLVALLFGVSSPVFASQALIPATGNSASVIQADRLAGAALSSLITIPTFSITKVEQGKSVTIETLNFPANDQFDVLMNKFGTLGVGGTKIETVQSGAGGELTFTFNVPDALKNETLIAIRLQSPKTGYYSYNWFVNSTASVPSTPVAPTPTPVPGVPVTGKIPTISIQKVVKDTSVTFKTSDYPASTSFDVLMGAFGTMGKNGTKAGSIDSGSGGTQTFTVSIPDSMKGKSVIAIRAQSDKTGYYSYNWFWNVTTP